jgi:hypothetical protein
MTETVNQQQALRLHLRITGLLEELPPSTGIRVTRTAILRSADAALAATDLGVLRKLDREAKVLAQAMRQSGGPRDAAASPTSNTPRALGVGLGPSAPRSTRSSRWRNREHAPIRYPYGKPPHGWDTRLHDTIESMPDSKSSAASLARLNAYRRSRAGQRVRYHGADEPPEWYWPDDPA